MIFLSVGTQLPFERVVGYLQRWLDEQPAPPEAFGQVATDGSTASFPTARALVGDQFLQKVLACDVFVSHAGMGNIITAIEHGRPIVIVPRLAAKGEHRNDHQIDTAARFTAYESVFVASDYHEFRTAMDAARAMRGISTAAPSPERRRLVNFVRSFISGEPG